MEYQPRSGTDLRCLRDGRLRLWRLRTRVGSTECRPLDTSPLHEGPRDHHDAVLSRDCDRKVRSGCVSIRGLGNIQDYLVPWLRARLLAADSLDTSVAIQWIEYWLRRFGQNAAITIEGVVASKENAGARIEKLYFDGPGADDWPALAQYRDSFVPALGPNHIFIPGQ